MVACIAVRTSLQPHKRQLQCISAGRNSGLNHLPRRGLEFLEFDTRKQTTKQGKTEQHEDLHRRRSEPDQQHPADHQ